MQIINWPAKSDDSLSDFDSVHIINAIKLANSALSYSSSKSGNNSIIDIIV
jgi:hypothetical protein